LLGCGVCGGTLGNAGGDQDAAELGEHVLEGGFGLGGVPGLGVPAGGDAGRVVAVPGVPGDDQGAGEQGERDDALDGAAGAVAIAIAVPGRRGPLPPELVQQPGQFLPADLGQRAVGAEPGEQPVQHAGVAAPGVRVGVPRRGQEGVGCGLDRAGVPFAQGHDFPGHLLLLSRCTG